MSSKTRHHPRPTPLARTLRRRLILLVSTALVVLGLSLVAPAAQAVTCAGAGCAPASLLNDTLLRSSSSRFVATAAQQASLQNLEDQAVANTISDHGLTESDAAAVRTWGREDAEGELWGLIVQAIRTDPASRSSDQQNAVDWLTDVMHHKAETAALNAGWEFLKWAGHVTATAPRPSSSDILSALDGYASGALLPANYMNGTPDNSDSGFCAYRPPVGFDGDYTGNITTPAAQSTADSWCFPEYTCQSMTGCNDNEPSFDSFVKWGEADVTGDPSQDTGFAATSHNVATGLEFGGAAVGAGVVGLALTASLGSVLTGSALTTALFPYTAAAIADFGWLAGETAQLPAEFAGGLAASAVGAVVSAAIIAIAIAVIKGIQVVAAAKVPGQLHDLITNALDGTPDLPAMLDDSTQLGGLYGMFIRATGPAPTSGTCDNSRLTLNADGTAPAPCGNAPAIADPAADDPQFLIQPLDNTGHPTGAATRSDTLDWFDAVATGQGGGPSWTSSARMSGDWFVTSTSSGGATLPPYQTLRIHYVNPDLQYTETSWLVKQPDGSDKFLTITGKSLLPPSFAPDPLPLDPTTCLADKTCALTDSIMMIKPDADGGIANGTAERVSVVPAVQPDLTISHSADPREGTPVTLTASNDGPDVGPLTYTWYVQSAANGVVCQVGDEFCGYDGPFTGAQKDYTWGTSGTFHVILLASQSDGRTTRTETDLGVGDVAPVLSMDPVTGPTTLPAATTVTGTVQHAGSLDSETVTIDWGDGTTDTASQIPGVIAGCPCNPILTVTSPTKLGFSGTHTYATPGSHTVTVTVSDQGGGTDTQQVTVDVIGTQTLHFPAIADHTYGDPAFDVLVSGGDSGQPVELTSNTPDVCTVSDPADAEDTASVWVRAAGTCTLEANQAGSTDYLPADAVQRSFTVDPAVLTVTAQDETMILHGAVPELSTTYHGFVDGDDASVVTGLTCTSDDGTGHPVSADTPVGSYPITCSGAEAANYRIGYRSGTLQVIYADAGFTGSLAGTGAHVVKAGSNVAIKWVLTDAHGVAISDRSSFGSVTFDTMACGGTATTDPAGGTTLGPASALKYDGSGVWQYNWKTPKRLRGSCGAVTVHLSDGTSHTAALRFG